MATEAQTLANRQNSLKSTGPRTPEGKDASRRNAMKHGLTARADLLGDEDLEIVGGREAAYRAQFRPADARENELACQMAYDSIRSERCRALHAVMINCHAQRAETCWDLDRRAEAEELASKLARDPGRVSHALLKTRHGCELVIERWEALGRILEAAGSWGEAQRAMALDLLGVHPDLRGGPTAVDAPEETDTRGFGRAFVAAEIERLKRLRSRLDNWDLDQREIAEKGLDAEMSKPLQLLHRYERVIHSRWFAAHHHFVSRDRNRERERDGSDPPMPKSPKLPLPPPRARAETASPSPARPPDSREPSETIRPRSAASVRVVPAPSPVTDAGRPPARTEPSTLPGVDRPLTRRQRKMIARQARADQRRTR